MRGQDCQSENEEHKQQATKVPQTTTVSPSEQCESKS